MDQEQEVELTAEEKAIEDAAFSAGFSTEPAASKGSNAEPVVEEVQSKSVPAEPAVEDRQTITLPKQKYAKVTEDQLAILLAKAQEIDALKGETKKIADASQGRYGDLKRALDQLQAGTQQGKPVELTAEDVAEISAMYPELGESTLKVLQKVASKLQGTRGAPAFDESKVDQRVMHQLTPALSSLKDTVRNEIAAEELAELHPDWRQIAGDPGQDTEFRRWLKTQPAGYESKVLDSSRAKVISEAITKFKESKTPPVKPKQNDRFASAIAPRSAGGNATQEPVDDFASAFARVTNKRS